MRAGTFILRTPGLLRALVLAAAFAVVLALTPQGAAPAAAQASRFAAEITKIELADKRMTLKSSMGQLTVRVAPDVALETLKPGDKVWITFGQDGTEPLVTSVEVIKS
jgi:Cu/Ag efflux protein CusF